MQIQQSSAERLQVDFDLSLDVVSERYLDRIRLGALRNDFERDGYAKLPGLFDSPCFGRLASEMRVVEKAGRDRSFSMPPYNTPRVLRTVGGQTVLRESPAIAALYFHRDLVDVLEAVTGSRVFPCQHKEEFIVANFLSTAGSTHGWHLDDPPLALVVFFEAPDDEQKGGRLEYIPRWLAHCSSIAADPEVDVEPTVERARAGGLVRSASHSPGDAYLLRADQCLHRVTPLIARDCRRVVLNMAYQFNRNQGYGDTATMLYGANSN